MTDLDRNLHKLLREESDALLFTRMDLSDRVKQKIRQQAAAEKAQRKVVSTKSWMMGTAALVAAVMIIAGLPLLQQPAAPAPAENPVGSLPPSNEGIAGSEQSSLITTPLNTVEEAKAAFGSGLLAPSVEPKGFTLSEIVAVGIEGKAVRDVIITYVSGEKSVTFVASRNPAAFPADLFTKTQVNGVDGFVFEQPGLTELFWVDSGIQYSITGHTSADDAMKVAESMEP